MPLIWYTDEHQPSPHLKFESFRRESQRWQAYSKQRLHPPRRVTLVGHPGGRLARGSPELRWCRGVRRLTLFNLTYETSL